jgi:5-methylcytosine-specific restriction endonuclease McrA
MCWSAIASNAKTAQQTSLHIELDIPLVEGDTNNLSNLHTLCQSCNLGKA